MQFCVLGDFNNKIRMQNYSKALALKFYRINRVNLSRDFAPRMTNVFSNFVVSKDRKYNYEASTLILVLLAKQCAKRNKRKACGRNGSFITICWPRSSQIIKQRRGKYWPQKKGLLSMLTNQLKSSFIYN